MVESHERLREDEIRPDRFREEEQVRFAADMRRLLSRKMEFVPVDCPACNCADHMALFEKHEIGYVECIDCGTLYVSPRPTPEILEMYYSQSEARAFWNNVIFPASQEKRRERLFKPRVSRVLDLCEKYSVGRELLIEVGAGAGIFCEEMRKAGNFRRIVGVEPNPEHAQTCRSRDVEVIELPIERTELGGARADVIASFEVIEHLFQPREFLERCNALLAPNGLLVLTCPNGKGFDIETMGAASDNVDIQHLNYFNPASLGSLVARCGLDVLEVSTPGKLDAELVRKKALAGEFSLDAQPFLREVLIERWDELGGPFQDFLAGNLLSSHMWLAARRR